jgi:hypothetical protein
MPDSIAAPVTNPTTIRMIFVLLCMNHNWVACIIDVEGAFLQGKFKNGEVIYTEVPDGMEEPFTGQNRQQAASMTCL